MAATLLAAFSRFHRIAALPPQAWVDEIWFALRARDLLTTHDPQLFYRTFWGGVHPLLVQLTAVAMAPGFKSMVTSRAISTVCGVLSVPLAFAAFREFWRREPWPASRRGWTAALTALVLSNWLYAVVVSRVGTEPALALVAGLFCAWQLLRALRTGRSTNYLAVGLAAGLTQYISPHARFILPLLAAMGLHALLLAAPGERRSRLVGLGLSALAAIFVALPLTVFFLREPEWFFARARAVTVIPLKTGPRFLLDNLRLILISFSGPGDLNPRHNLPGRPLFDPIQSVGFWIGLLVTVVRFRRSAPARELLAWAAIMITPSLITDEAPQFERLIGFAPAGAALVAIGWMEIWGEVSAWLSRVDWGFWSRGFGRWSEMRRKLRIPRGQSSGTPSVSQTGLPWLHATALSLVALSLGINGYTYFVRYSADPGLSAALTTTPVRLALELAERSRAEPVFVERITEIDDVFAFDFLFPGTSVRRLDFRQCLPLSHRRPQRTTYLVLTERDRESRDHLARAFPAAKLAEITPEDAALMGDAMLVEVPAGEPAPPFPVPTSASFGGSVKLLGYGWSGPTVRAGGTIFLTLYWQAESKIESDLTTFLHVGTGLGDSPLVGQRDGQPCQGLYPTSQWLPGDVVPDGFAITIPKGAPPGEYPLSVGWYQYPSLERLPLIEADASLSDNRAVIGAITVTAP